MKRLTTGPGGKFVGGKRKARSVLVGRREFYQGGEEGMTVELLRSGTGQETGGEGWKAEGAFVGREVWEESKQMSKKSRIQGEKERQPGEFNFGTNLGRGGGDLGSRGGGCGEKRVRAKKALATVANLVLPMARSQTSPGKRSWGTRSPTAPGRRSPRAEVTGREFSSLERVMKVTNDASLGLRLAQVKGKGRGVLVSLVYPLFTSSKVNLKIVFDS